jgi:putative membrane protein insertion efficiency factor
MTPLAWVFDKGIAGYQYVRGSYNSPCRHIPSCSVYGREALAEHGAVKGSWLTARRIGRCNPWGTHGHDPVPPKHSHDASNNLVALPPTR